MDRFGASARDDLAPRHASRRHMLSSFVLARAGTVNEGEFTMWTDEDGPSIVDVSARMILHLGYLCSGRQRDI